jgi:hypothetical protein
MKFPDHLDGPKFEDGDITVFTFQDAEFICRLPKIPNYERRYDRVSDITNFSTLDTSDWSELDDCWMQNIVMQTWIFEDIVSSDNIASCGLKLGLVAEKNISPEWEFFFEPSAFKTRVLSFFKQDYGENCPYAGENGDYKATFIGQSVPVGVKMQGPPEVDTSTSQRMLAHIPLNPSLTMVIGFTLYSLHYDNRKNPYSEDLLNQFKIDLFDDFLSHIQIHYTGETAQAVARYAR